MTFHRSFSHPLLGATMLFLAPALVLATPAATERENARETAAPIVVAQAESATSGRGGQPNEEEATLVSAQSRNPQGMGHTDQSDMVTPDAFRFPGHMASVWSKPDVEGLLQDTYVTMPLMIHDQEFFEEGVYVWDAWPVRNPDGSVAVIDDWVVMVGLSAEWDEVDETGWEFFTVSTWRYWLTRDGEWQPGGVVFARDEALGSRQWAGSTFYDADSQTVTFYYTATGRPDAESIDDDMPDHAISIHNEAAGRPSIEQRLAAVTASVAASDEGITFHDFGAHEILLEADGFWYDTRETYLAGEAVYGFRDPEYMVDPHTGREHILFTANAAGVPGPYNGVVGMATRMDDGSWALDPPLIVSTGVNSQLERPHVIYREDGAYLFFSTHDFTFAPDLHGPRGLYGFYSPTGSLAGRWLPLNKHGLVAANPHDSPAQTYSYLVLPDGLVMSYLNHTYGFDLDPEHDDREFYGGPGPMFRIEVDGETAVVAEAENVR
jgi:levansucrase